MKRLQIEPGIKTSLADLVNKSQDVWFENYIDLVTRVFTPGFFVGKSSTDGTLLDDFKPSIATAGSDYIIQVSIRGRNPAFCYTAGGKIIALYETIRIDPRDINGFSYYNTTLVENVSKVYELWIIPRLITTESADYLPNYKQLGETKPLVQQYMASLLLIEKGQSPPIVIPEESDVTGLPPSQPPREVPTIEGLKIAEFTYNSYTRVITNLEDKRSESRAYIRPELYDFFSESFLKHDFILGHAESSVADVKLSFFKVQGQSPKLNGIFTLLGSKARYSDKLAKIKVTANNVSTPVDSVVGVTITPNEFSSAVDIEKPLEVISLSTYTPSVNFLVIGYHMSNSLSNGIVVDPPEGDGPEVGAITEGDTPDVETNTSVLYFVNGLPPLPPGHYISKVGIGSYMLTKDEAAASYYNKAQTDARYIESTAGKSAHLSDLRHNITANRNDDYALRAVNYITSVNQVTKAGYGWVTTDEQNLETVLGYIVRKSDTQKGILEFGVFNDTGLALYGIKLENGFVRFFGEGNQNPSGDPNNFLTVAHGLLNSGDTAHGDYAFKVGRVKYYKPNEQYFSNNESPETMVDSGTGVLCMEFIYDTTDNVVADFKNHIVTGVADPRPGTIGELDVVNRSSLEKNTVKKKTTLETYQEIPVANTGYVGLHAITEPQPELGTNIVMKDQNGNTGSLIPKHFYSSIYTDYPINGPGSPGPSESFSFPSTNTSNMVKSPGLYLALVSGCISIDPTGVDIELPVIDIHVAVNYIPVSEIMSVHSAPSSSGAIVTIPFSFTIPYTKLDFETKYMTVEIATPYAANITSTKLKKLSLFIIKLA